VGQMKPLASVCVVVGTLSALTGAGLCRTWHVIPDRSGDAPTIQAGIDSSASGDTVMLGSGTFMGPGNRNIRYHGRSLYVRSLSGDPSSCTVDCSFQGRGFIFDPGDGPGAVLEGVTIARGRCLESIPPADSGGGGIWCDSASPTIKNVVITECDAEIYGGGIWCSGDCSPTLTGVLVTGCLASAGAGMYCRGSSPVLTDVTFFDNYAVYPGTGGGMFCEGGAPILTAVGFLENAADAGTGGLMVTENCGAELRNVTFAQNVGLNGCGGLYCGDSSPLVVDCQFSLNWGSSGGAIELNGGSSPHIEGCTIFGNWGGGLGAVTNQGEGSPVFERAIIAGTTSGAGIFPDCAPVVLTCCNIYGNAGGDWTGCLAAECGRNGNFSADPLFCDPVSVDLTLEKCSPCLPGHHPDGHDCGGVIGAFGVGCECGAGSEPAMWGWIKALYR
jgi:hypothetical protein